MAKGRTLCGSGPLLQATWSALLGGTGRTRGRGRRRAGGDLGELLGAGDDGLELGSRAELGNRGLLRPRTFARSRVTHHAGRADGLLEGAESGDCDLLALGDLTHHGVDNGLERVRSGSAVAVE